VLADRRNLWWLYLAGGTFGCALYEFVPPFEGNAELINLLGLSGVVAVVAGIRIHRPRAGVAWWLFVLGLLLFWVGDVYTYSIRVLYHLNIPFPSFGDAVYLAVYPVQMAGLLVLVRRRNQRADGPGLIDSLIMTLGLALVSWVLLIAPYVHAAGLSLLYKLVSIGYPTGDIILLAAAIRLAVDRGKRRPAFFLLIASIVSLLTSDFVYGIASLHSAYHHQLTIDVGWIYFYLLWGAAALHPSMRELADPATEVRSRFTPLRLGLLAGATMVAPVLEILSAARHHDADLIVITAASIVLFALVVGRMAGLIRQRDRSVSRENALTAAGGHLVAAQSPSDIARAALRAVVDLGAGEMDARLCRLDAGAADVQITADGDDGLTEWTASDAVRDALRSGDGTGVVRLSAAVRSELRLAAADEPGLAIGLGSDPEPGAVLVVTGRAAVAPEIRAALWTLANQVSLALESSQLSEEIHRRASEARLSTLVQNSSDLITIVAADNTVSYQSPSIEAVLGYTVEEVTGRPFSRLLHPDEQGRLLLRLADGAGTAPGHREPIECVLAHKDGSPRQFEIFGTDLLDDSSVQGIVLNGRDVSERKAFEEQLAHQAFHDSVTQLANRALFNERVRHAVTRVRRDRQALAIIFIDLDDFKTVNDSLGHAAGDMVLREVAHRFTANVRAVDTAARFGGDEFAVLLENIPNEQAAVETAERILMALSRPIDLGDNTLVISASLGIAIADPGTSVGADELIRNADVAMYIAKAERDGGYRIFEPGMHQRALSRLELRADLERALTRDEFEIHYQPIVRLDDGVVCGVEALLRWNHPTKGPIAPDDFIPFAEETGLIVAIGRWVLFEGCRQARILRDRSGAGVAPGMGINLSVKQLFHPDIVRDVAGALAAAGLDPAALTLEITESVVMNDTDTAVRRLNELRECGVRLAMDDFGTGYSSLSYLSQLPIDVLKMDRSLLAAGASPVTSGLATAVLGLGETFRLDVVAEGIEFREQSQTLLELGCEVGQGYLFARPMPADDIADFIASRAGGASALTAP
jgi:diguanylate cyclase (GGDEF)-like protein/PAS domain S-box-containing protein